MPASRSERIVFGLGLGTIAVLSALLLVAWRSYAGHDVAQAALPPQPSSSARTATFRPPATPPASTTTSSSRATRPNRPQKPAATPTKSRPAVTPATTTPPRLVLTALRGDCWLSVHSGSATGATLYEGTLARGDKVNFPLGTVWVRFGAPQNVEALVAKKRVRVPTSSFNVVFTRSGATPAPES